MILSIFTGCQKKKESYTVGEWLKKVNEEAEIPASYENKPYFLNIAQDHEHFDAVQASVEWGIISTEVHLDPNAKLTKEWIAYTLMNLYGNLSSSQKIKDSSKSQFPEHIAAAVSLGILDVDSRNCFNPTQVYEKDEAEKALQNLIQYLNNWNSNEEVVQIVYSDEIKHIIDSPLHFSLEERIAVFEGIDFDLKVNDLITFEDNENEIYKVEAIILDGNKSEIYFKEAQFDDVIEESDIQKSFEVDFDEVEFETEGELGNDVSFSNPLFQKLAKKEFSIEGFTIQLNASGSSMSARVSKSLSNGGTLSADLKLYNVKPSIRWKNKGMMIEDAYFKVNYSTAASLSLYKGRNKHLYSDFSFLNKDNFLSSLQKSFKNDLTHVTATIPLGTLKIPVPNISTMNIMAKLQLYLYANGKMELSLVNDFDMGIEIRNNKLRFFSDQESKSDFLLRASGGVIGSINLGLEMLTMNLVDLSLQAGIRGKIESKVYFKGSDEPMKTKVEYDFLESVAGSNFQLKACGELSAHWVLDVVVNTDATVAAKMGMSLKKSLLNGNNASIIPKNMRYIENGKFVSACFQSILNEENIEDNLPIFSNKISLKSYNLILHPQESQQIEVIQLPSGYTLDDLEMSSNNLDVIEISDTRIYAKERGAAIVTIQTKDQAYKVTCNILVAEKRNENSLP